GACCFGPVDSSGHCCSGGFGATLCNGQCCNGACNTAGGCCVNGTQACGSTCCSSPQVCLNPSTSSCGAPAQPTLVLIDPPTNQITGQSGGPPVNITNSQEILVQGLSFSPGQVVLSVDTVGGPQLGTATATAVPNQPSFSILIQTELFPGGSHKL